jgi:hypothetical protein
MVMLEGIIVIVTRITMVLPTIIIAVIIIMAVIIEGDIIIIMVAVCMADVIIDEDTVVGITMEDDMGIITLHMLGAETTVAILEHIAIEEQTTVVAEEEVQ